jgi:hypothetical protein
MGESVMANIKVRLPSGQLVPMRVPDDWDQKKITEEIHKQFPIKEKFAENLNKGKAESPEPKERTGLLGVGSDLAQGLSGAAKFAIDIPKKLEKSGKYIEENPGSSILHNAGQLAAEAGDIGKGLINAPYNLNQYLARKHLLPQVLGKLGKIIPHLPENMGVEKALGLEEDVNKGDDLIRAIPDIASIAVGGFPLGKAIVKKATSASKERLFKRALEENIDKAAKAKGLAKGELDELKDSLALEYSKTHPSGIGELTPTGQKVAINQKNIKLSENPMRNEIPEGEVPSIPERPDTKAMLEQHQKAIDEAKESAENHLDILNNPTIKAGGKIKKAIENLHDKASDLYKAARNHYSDKKIMADNSAEIKDATQELEALRDADELAPGYGSGTAEQKALEANIEALKGEKVNASDIFDLQRTMEKMAENTRDKQFSSGKGLTDLQRKRYGEIADKLDAHAEKLAKRLESVGGKDVRKIITEANKGWRTYKQLSKENPVGKAAYKAGSVPSQTLIELAKDHPANDFLKGLVNSDEELRKQLLAAYSGEKNVNKLLKPSRVIDEYVKSLPEVEEKLNAFKNALSDFKSGEKEVAKIDKAHDALVKSMKDAADAKKLQQQIKFHEQAIPKIKAKMDNLDAKSAEHAKLEKELKMHEQHLADKNHLLRKYGTKVIGFLGINEIAKKFGI